MRELFPEIVTFRITAKCTQDCHFCYGPKNKPDLNINSLRRIFSLLVEGGVKSIVLTGGEPLIRNDIGEIFSIIKDLGLKIFLDTNADLFFKRADLINSQIEILGLPLDSLKIDFGGHSNPMQIIKVLDYYKELSVISRPKIKIGTVVTIKNINQLEEIAEAIKDYPIDYWKLYQFIPVGISANEFRQDFLIDEDEFLKLAQNLASKYAQKINILISTRRKRANAYFLINPNGEVIMPEDDGNICREIIVGHIFDNMILAKWHDHILEKNYLINAEQTFDHDFENYPMSQIYNRIWQISRRYNQKGQFYTEQHIKWLISQGLDLADKENLNDKIFMPLILLHDVGYCAVKKESPFKTDTRKGHMRAGKTLAKKILKQVNYPKRLTNKICRLIGIHDNWSFGEHQLYKQNTILGAFNDLDFISMYSNSGFESMAKILNRGPREMLNYLNNNEKIFNRPFISKNSFEIFQDELRQVEMKLRII